MSDGGLRSVLRGALDRLALRYALADVEALAQAVEPLVMSNISVGVAGGELERQSWQRLYEAEHERRVQADKYATIVADLDRCEHGRHEGDVCSSCGGPSQGNPLWRVGQGEAVTDARAVDELYGRLWERFGESRDWPPRLVGFGLEGVPICVPERPTPGSAPRTADGYYRRDLR